MTSHDTRRDQIIEALVTEWMARSDSQVKGSPTEHCGALADAVMPILEAYQEDLRSEFIRLLTQDSETTDMRRREFNQGIFFSQDDKWFPGAAKFNGTDLEMVLDKFDKAVKNLETK